jgi:hypothetical protein
LANINWTCERFCAVLQTQDPSEWKGTQCVP